MRSVETDRLVREWRVRADELEADANEYRNRGTEATALDSHKASWNQGRADMARQLAAELESETVVQGPMKIRLLSLRPGVDFTGSTLHDRRRTVRSEQAAFDLAREQLHTGIGQDIFTPTRVEIRVRTDSGHYAPRWSVDADGVRTY